MLHCLFVKRVFTIVVKPLLLSHAPKEPYDFMN